MKALFFLFILSAVIGISFTSSDWFKYLSEEGKYEVHMPNAPVKQEQTIETEMGELLLNMVMYDASEDGDLNFIYLVNYTDYPIEHVNSEDKELTENFLNASINESAANIGGEIIETNKISLTGFPGKEVLIETGPGAAMIDMKLYLVHNRLYMLQVITTPQNIRNENAQKFFKSFRLI